MTSEEPANPYLVSNATRAVWLTPLGFTPGQCFFRFVVAGLLAAACGSVALYAVSGIKSQSAIVYQLLSLGLPFGVALWLAIQRHIGSISTLKKIVIVFGCLAAFVVCGAVYLSLLPRRFMYNEPLTWEILRAYVFGPSAGALVLTIVLWLAGNRLSFRVLTAAWLAMSVIGGVALLISDETGVRRQIIDETLAASLCGGVYLSSVLGIVGWQLGEANSTPTDAR
ncbi:MAG: hypothetical protein R3C49_21020 [Planctomycetaceae bacterium]